ncbi:enoyl-CoA hydratase/isomerase family protein [Gordonia sp. TBRC 11910]|uniref:Enoyl-CoA hydratase/isomerase family protein n=1 Tax=Gordonia asplenii TaxID=2725283 RepID=A0A848L294_9ACTN|nr:enoyl-CoA hydratase/isomerase family protein [Gordonia asplenii]NMO05140.1 enoyl-CoA hydratase/isomerase family protein [Gordonia asplenii]
MNAQQVNIGPYDEQPCVVRSDVGSTAVLRLNRPSSMNALSARLISELDDHLADIETDSSRVVVLTGTGRAFCAGADLKELLGPGGDVDAAAMLAFERRGAAVFSRLAALPLPVIVAINGLTMAGGLELALHGDIIVADEDARIGDGHIGYGMVPGAGGGIRLARAIGRGRAKYLAFTGALLSATQCLDYGLVQEVTPAGELDTRCADLAAQLAERSPSALRLFKTAIDDGMDQPLATAHRLEHLLTAEHLLSGDVDEGLRAFREKRAPNFR